MTLPLTPLIYQPPGMHRRVRRAWFPTVGMLIILTQVLYLTQQRETGPEDREDDLLPVAATPPPILPETIESEPPRREEATPLPVYPPEMPLRPVVREVDVRIAPDKPQILAAGYGMPAIPPGDVVVDFALLDRKPGVLQRGPLQYPPELKRERVEGRVLLKVLILEDGRVRVLDVVEADHPGFEKPAIRAAEQSLFESPRRNGEVVRTAFLLPITFRLD